MLNWLNLFDILLYTYINTRGYTVHTVHINTRGYIVQYTSIQGVIQYKSVLDILLYCYINTRGNRYSTVHINTRSHTVQKHTLHPTVKWYTYINTRGHTVQKRTWNPALHLYEYKGLYRTKAYLRSYCTNTSIQRLIQYKSVGTWDPCVHHIEIVQYNRIPDYDCTS